MSAPKLLDFQLPEERSRTKIENNPFAPVIIKLAFFSTHRYSPLSLSYEDSLPSRAIFYPRKKNLRENLNSGRAREYAPFDFAHFHITDTRISLYII